MAINTTKIQRNPRVFDQVEANTLDNLEEMGKFLPTT